MNIYEKIKYDYDQYGFWTLCVHIFKALLRKIGISYNVYYYLINEVNYSLVKSYWDSHNIDDAKDLTYEDFLLDASEAYPLEKLEIIKTRLTEGGYYAYGVIRDGKLAYSNMISLNEFIPPYPLKKGELNVSDFLNLNDYCAPEYRGRGIHGAMCAYRLLKGLDFGKKRAITIILKGNKPALNAHLRLGSQVAFKYYTLSLWGNNFTNLYKRLNNLK